jgi:hypothetical protein
MSGRQFDTIAALFDEDAARPMSLSDLDDALWLLLIAKIAEPAELARYEPPVGVYLASRWLESEVGNGGFAQAAYNIPQWFELAEAAYAALGKRRAAALIRDARRLLPAELALLDAKRLRDGATIEEVFRHFDESALAALDQQIPEDEWWIDDERIEYARRHQSSFRKVV